MRLSCFQEYYVSNLKKEKKIQRMVKNISFVILCFSGINGNLGFLRSSQVA